MIKFGTKVPPDVEARIPALVERLAADERVAAVWLFGSRARGEADALSDVDVAALAVGNPKGEEIWRCELEWVDAAIAALRTDEVSLIVLNGAPLALRYEVLRNARLLFARSPEAAVDYELETIRRFLDFRAHLDEYDRQMFASAGAGRLR